MSSSTPEPDIPYELPEPLPKPSTTGGFYFSDPMLMTGAKVKDLNDELEVAMAQVLKKYNVPENTMFAVMYAWEEIGITGSASTVSTLKIAGTDTKLEKGDISMPVYKELTSNIVDRAIQNGDAYKKLEKT